MVLTVIASVFDVEVLLVVALALGIVGAICFAIVASVTNYNTKLKLEPPVLRGFKGDELNANVVLEFRRGKWIAVKPTLIDAPFGLETKSDLGGNNSTRISLSSKYAGRLSGLGIQIEVTDIMNLFSKKIQTIQVDFVFDCLPLSILTPLVHTKPIPLALGERSGMSAGSSPELYALKEYTAFTETKDILWKRVAGMPDERLVVRVRDSSLPKTVRIGFLVNAKRDRDVRLSFIDLACEGAGMIMNLLLAAGCVVEVIDYSDARGNGQGLEVSYVKEFPELADALMKVSSNGSHSDPDFEYSLKVSQRADIIVCGMRELEDPKLSVEIARKPTLAIMEDRSSPYAVGEQTLFYSGLEDVRKIVSRVLEK